MKFVYIYIYTHTEIYIYVYTFTYWKDRTNNFAYDLPKETITAMRMLFKNTKVMVHLPNSHVDFFDDVIGAFQGDS